MTESTTEQKLCLVGRSTESPCPFPATVGSSYVSPEGEPQLCAFHAATQPLAEKLDEVGACLELARGYLKGARRQEQAVPPL